LVTKINISIREEVLDELDKAAGEAGTSRSAFIAQAVEHFLQEKEKERIKEKRRKAAEGIDKLREKLGDWDATGEILKWRQLH